MTSEVTVCSNALQILGASPINSFNEGTQDGGLDTARLCSNLWPTVRDAILRSHSWNCAKARVQLSPEITTPAFNYSYRYVLPSDWLRNIEVNGVVSDAIDFEVETVGDGNGSKRILLDSSQLNLVYIWRNKDVESWDPMLTAAVELAMAARMAYAITQSTSLMEKLDRDLSRYLARCRAVDGQDESPQQLGSLEILGARRAISYNY